MLRWRAFVLGKGWFLVVGCAAFSAAAQPDGAPVPQPEPPPVAPTEPVAPPTPPADVPPVDAAPAPPPAAPPPAPSGEFPLPPPAAEKPATRPVPPPSLVAPEPAPQPPAQSPPQAQPRRATEGLFEEKKPAEVRHHESEDEGDKTDQFKIGPVVGAGIPSLLSVGGTIKVTRFLGAGVNLGLIPTVQLSYYGDATLSYKHLDFYGRIYPFGGGFFLGAGAGYVTVDGTLKKTYEGASYEGNGSVRTLMLTALLGYFHTFDIGLSLGIDAGAQIPIAPSKIDFESKITGIPPNTPAPLQAEIAKRKAEADQSVRDTLEKIGRTTLPTLNFRIGWIL